MRENITTYILCGFFVVLACIVQSFAYLNGDSAWLIDSASKLLSGKDLYTDYVETNPPFIVYFFAIPTWLGNMVGVHPAITFKIFVIGITLAGLFRSFKYAETNFIKIIIAFGLFALSVQSFGQREQIFLALMLPCFLCVMKGQRAKPLDTAMLALGILMKPYFVIYFAGFVFWQVFVQKRSLFLKENFAVGFALVAYMVLAWFTERDYFTQVVPLLNKYYSQFYFKRVTFDVKAMTFFMMAISLRVLLPAHRRDKDPIIDEKTSFAIFAAFLGGAILILQDKGWTNHFLHLYFFLTLSIAMLMERSTKWLQGVLSLILLTIFVHVTYVTFVEMHSARDSGNMKEVIRLQDEYAAGKDVLQISFSLNTLYPEVLYSKADFNWEYPALWMIVGMYDGKDVKNESVIFHKPEEQGADEAKIFNSYVDYVVNKKPAMLVYSNKKLNNERLGNFQFNLIEYFSQDARFAEQFRKYKVKATIGMKRIYVLDQQGAEANIPAKR